MKKARGFICITGCLIVLSLGLLGCSSDGGGGGGGGYTLSGTLIRTTAPPADGRYAFLKLVGAGGNPEDEALYYTDSTAFSSGHATFSMSGIEEGTYRSYVFIDLDGGDTPGNKDAFPEDGDYVTGSDGDFVLNADMNVTVNDGDWDTWPVE